MVTAVTPNLPDRKAAISGASFTPERYPAVPQLPPVSPARRSRRWKRGAGASLTALLALALVGTAPSGAQVTPSGEDVHAHEGHDHDHDHDHEHEHGHHHGHGHEGDDAHPDDHSHGILHDYSEDQLPSLADPYRIEQRDLAVLLGDPGDPGVPHHQVWDGPDLSEISLPEEEKYLIPGDHITPASPRQLMSGDSGYLAYMAEQGETIDPANLPAPPTKVGLPTQVDAFPGWVFQYGISCDPNNKPGMLAFSAMISAHYNRPSGSMARPCVAGARSMHHDGRAMDWPLNAYNAQDRAIGDAVAQWLTANDGEMARRFGVQSVIWNKQAWYSTLRYWMPFDGHPHDDHIHFGFTWDGAMMRTSWWSGTSVTVPDQGTCRIYENQYAPRYTTRNTSACPTNLPPPPPSSHPVLLPGANHNSVRYAQEKMGFTGGDVDGKFGPMTLTALLGYQAANGVPVTGVLDNATFFQMANGTSPDPRLIPVERISGNDRFAVAAALARSFPTGGDLYVTSGDDYPDALSASARAGNINSPVLLVKHNSIPLATVEALNRAKPTRIIVAGGTESVSATTLNQLRAYATSGTAIRRAGDDRFATAAAVSASWGTNVPVVYVANGNLFPDGLTGSARAAHMNGPVLLTQADRVPQSTIQAMNSLKPGRVVVLGGTSSITSATASQLASLTRTGNMQRVGGDDRYHLAALLAAYYPTNLDVVYVATGETYQDALAAAARAGANAAPVVLVRQNSIPNSTRQVLRDLKPKKIIVVGGTTTVSTAVAQQLARIMI